MDRFHENLGEIFLLERTVETAGKTERWAQVAQSLGSQVKAVFPQVERMSRIGYFNLVAKNGEKVFSESVASVDDDFLRMFSLYYGIRW